MLNHFISINKDGRFPEKTEPSKPTAERVQIIDALRGIAALAVCWFHFTQSTGDSLPEGLVKKSGEFGFLGVNIFFVISGFVIPLTLLKCSYEIRGYFRFVARRVVRLDPPYFVSLILVLAVGFALMHFTNSHAGQLPYESVPQILLHLGYLNVFFGYQFLNPIYWTLAIEFQYYLLLGLTFPMLFHSRQSVRRITIIALCTLPFFCKNHQLLFRYMPWFLFGTSACYFYAKQISWKEYAGATLLLSLFCGYLYGPLQTAPLVCTSLLISFHKGPISRVLGFFGAISYSLYLTHAPIGCAIINLSSHFEPSFSGKLGVLALAWTATIVASYLMYRFIEKPALQLASQIRYQKRPTPENIPEPLLKNSSATEETATSRNFPSPSRLT
jgi:peptidoglycan/LPS O-acetylase OafA/YrhL